MEVFAHSVREAGVEYEGQTFVLASHSNCPGYVLFEGLLPVHKAALRFYRFLTDYVAGLCYHDHQSLTIDVCTGEVYALLAIIDRSPKQFNEAETVAVRDQLLRARERLLVPAGTAYTLYVKKGSEVFVKVENMVNEPDTWPAPWLKPNRYPLPPEVVSA